jgi:hypothetical protein
VYTTTPRFDASIKNAGKRRTVVDIYVSNQLVESDLPVSEGSITVDRSARSRRSGTVTIADSSLMPRLAPEDELSPFSTELVLRTGIVYADNTEELIPQGRFVITAVTGAVENGLIPVVTLLDRAERVFELGPGLLNYSGSDAFSSIASMVGEPSVTWTPLSIDPTLTNRVIAAGQADANVDRWQLVSSLATSIGADIYFSREGDPILAPTTHITPETNTSVWTIASGEDGTMIASSKSYSRTDVYNAVRVTGSATNSVIPQATVYDTDNRSPTFFGGPFGEKLLVINDSSVTDTGACYNRAIAELRRASGLAASVTFTAVANPALDVGDIVTIEWPDDTSQFVVINTLTFSLLDGSMSGTTAGMTFV